MPGAQAERRSALLVEDTPEMAWAVRRRLESEGYAVQCAANGVRALQWARVRRPDVVILDWMLPGMDGLEVLRLLRRRYPALPVLMLTARSADEDKIAGLESGADDYLTKPFSLSELVARLGALLRRANLLQGQLRQDRTSSGGILRYRRLQLDESLHAASLAGQSLELTPLEFGLLRLLLRHPGRTFSRDYLLDTVWGSEVFVGDRAVDNTVMRLRRKLGQVGRAIESVWGLGYRLAPAEPDSPSSPIAEDSAPPAHSKRMPG